MKKIIVIAAYFLAVTKIYSQVGINTDSPDPSAILHVKSEDKGVLFPQMQLVSANSFAPLSVAPPENTIVFNIASTGTGINKLLKGYYIWRGNNWVSPAINVTTKVIAKYQTDTDTTFNFNDNTAGKTVKVFNTELINDDPAVFEVVNPEELKILKTGTYLITTNLGLKNTTAAASQAEIYMAYYYGDVLVSSQIMSRVPQQRGANVNNKFNYSLIDYVSVATPGQNLKLRVTKNNAGDSDFITYDLDNFSSISIVRISDTY